MGSLDHMVVLFLIFGIPCILFFSSWLYQFTFPLTQCSCISFSSYPHQHLLSTVTLIVGSLIRVSWYHTVVLICTNLINDIEHFFLYLLAIDMSSLEKYVFSYSFNFILGHFFLCCELNELLMSLILTHFQIYGFRLFSPIS